MTNNFDNNLKKVLEEKETLVKKIKKLEDEIEELEDEIEESEDEIEELEDKIEELEDEIEDNTKVTKRLYEDLNNLKDILADKEQELNVKMSSLNFIQEILSAPEFGANDIVDLNKKITHFEAFIKDQFIDDVNRYLFTICSYGLSWRDEEGINGFNLMKQYYYERFDQWASTKRKSWLDGKTTIAFVGEFSAGKTSIVNRILSQDNPSIPKLPVSTKATTAVPTYIAGGPVVSYSFIAGDGKRKTILENTFKKVSKDILDQVKGVSSLIKYFVMTYKNPNLEGLSILDTPGFNSNDKEDRERTIDVINECDALFWVFDVNAGTINRSSISLIKEKLNKPLYVVINKVDTKSESEIRKVEHLIQQTLSNEGIIVQQFIRFSSKTPLSNIMNPIMSVEKIDGRDTFVDDVKMDLEQILQIYDEGVKEQNKFFYEEAIPQGNAITDQFNDCMKALQTDCETAYNIPQWVEHIFSDDRFEMTAVEGKQLQDLLAQIYEERVPALAQKFDERVEKADEIQEEWKELTERKTGWKKVKDCLEQYKRIAKNFK